MFAKQDNIHGLIIAENRCLDKTVKRNKNNTHMNLKLQFLYKIAPVFIKITILSLFMLSCSVNSAAFKEIDNAVTQSDYYSAIKIIARNQSGGASLYNEKNSISLFMDKGLLEYYAGNYAASSAALQNAERLIEEAYTKSITQGFFSYIINDNVKNYPGEDFEDIYINIFNALNYYNRGNIEGALVEIRKLSNTSGKLDMLARKYEYKDPNTGASLRDLTLKETGISQMPETKSVNFSNSALARFLGALFYQAAGNTDAARIEFDQLQRAFNTNRNIYSFPVPLAAAEARNVPAGKARLNIISFTGLSPIKEEQRILHFLPFQHPVLQIAMFKLPVLTERPSWITRTEVIVNGGNNFTLELLEDMGAVIKETYNAHFSNIMIKTYIRTILKYVAADIAAMETARKQDEISGLLIAAAARAALDASESADIRMSRYLPDKAYIGGINLEPGKYSVRINYYNNNNLITSENFHDVIVKQNGLNLLQSIYLR